jgi:hypothetical protein
MVSSQSITSAGYNVYGDKIASTLEDCLFFSDFVVIMVDFSCQSQN